MSIPGALLRLDGDERYSTPISKRIAVKAEESLNAEIAQGQLSDLFPYRLALSILRSRPQQPVAPEAAAAQPDQQPGQQPDD